MKLEFRTIVPEDARLLWEWANEEGTRRYSFHPAPIPWETHEAWVQRQLTLCAAGDVYWQMLLANGSPVGQIRYAREEGAAVISLCVAPDQRGHGYGQTLVGDTVQAASTTLQAPLVRALVLAENEGSRRLFRHCGFEEQPSEQIEGKECYTYLWRGR